MFRLLSDDLLQIDTVVCCQMANCRSTCTIESVSFWCLSVEALLIKANTYWVVHWPCLYANYADNTWVAGGLITRRRIGEPVKATDSTDWEWDWFTEAEVAHLDRTFPSELLIMWVYNLILYSTFYFAWLYCKCANIMRCYYQRCRFRKAATYLIRDCECECEQCWGLLSSIQVTSKWYLLPRDFAEKVYGQSTNGWMAARPFCGLSGNMICFNKLSATKGFKMAVRFDRALF